MGYRLLRVSQTDLRLAEIVVRLGHPFPAAAAMVGPRVGAPLIALLMIVWGTMVTQRDVKSRDRSFASTVWWRLNWLGVALALYAFMADSLRMAHEGIDATRTLLPTAFNWPVFVVALVLMAAPVAHIGYSSPLSRLSDRLRRRRRSGHDAFGARVLQPESTIRVTTVAPRPSRSAT